MSANFGLYLFLSVASLSLFSFLAVAAWSDARRRERDAYYRSDTLKRIAEAPAAGAVAALEILRDEHRQLQRHARESYRLGGVITIGVGIGLMVFLRAVSGGEPAYLVGLIPMMAGVGLLIYVYGLAPADVEK